MSVSVARLDDKGELNGQYESIRMASKQAKTSERTIRRCLSNPDYTTRQGFSWIYIEAFKVCRVCGKVGPWSDFQTQKIVNGKEYKKDICFDCT